MSAPDTGKRNRSLTVRLLLMAAGSFAFGFALVPLYDVFCEVTGIGSDKTLTRAGSAEGQVPVLEPHGRRRVHGLGARGRLAVRAGRDEHGSAPGQAL